MQPLSAGKVRLSVQLSEPTAPLFPDEEDKHSKQVSYHSKQVMMELLVIMMMSDEDGLTIVQAFHTYPAWSSA